MFVYVRKQVNVLFLLYFIILFFFSFINIYMYVYIYIYICTYFSIAYFVNSIQAFVFTERRSTVTIEELPEEALVATGFRGACAIFYSAALLLWELPQQEILTEVTQSLSKGVCVALVQRISTEMRKLYAVCYI
jgi:hypothetical protein